MTTQELKQSIEKVLGNNIRCLLPSYWWKRLFNQVADRIDEVEQSTSELVVSSLEEFEKKHPSIAERTFHLTTDATSEKAKHNARLIIRIYNEVYLGAQSGTPAEVAPVYLAVPSSARNEAFYITSPSFIVTYLAKFYGVVLRDESETLYDIIISEDGTYEAIPSLLGGSSVEVDTSLSTSSTNPVQNKVVTKKINEIDTKLSKPDVACIYLNPTSPEKEINAAIRSRIINGENIGLIGVERTNHGNIIYHVADYDSGFVDGNTTYFELYLFRYMGASADEILLPELADRHLLEGKGCKVTITGDGSIIDREDFFLNDNALSDFSTNAVQNKVVTKALNNKVDKVSGKQLSTEDFTTALKTKLEGLNAFDPTEINNKVDGLQTQLNTLVSGDASTAIESFNEIIAFLNGVTDSETLDGIIASIEQQIANKQDTLVSGTNIKTINGESILGEGNIVLNADTSSLATKEELESLTNEVITNEEVVAAAFNEINERINEAIESQSNYYTKLEVDNKIASSITNAINASY